jgi:RNA polymerase sporulation-specific sigma factor
MRMSTTVKEIKAEDHLGLVIYLVNKYHSKNENLLSRHGVDTDDLIQIGSIGLMKAANNFNPEIGVAFSTYASRIINGEIIRYFRDNGNLVKFPRSCKEIAARLAVEKINPEDATVEKIIELVGCSERIAEQALQYLSIKMVSSLDKPITIDGEDETSLMDIIPANEQDIDFEIMYANYLLLLTENEKLSVELTMAGLSQHEIAPILGVAQT